MAAKSQTTSFEITLERPRSGPLQGQWRAYLSGRKEPFVGKTPGSCMTQVMTSINTIVAELDGKAEATTATKTRSRAVAAN